MTHPAPVTLPARPPDEGKTFRINPAPGSPLDQLMDRRAAAKARKDEAAAEFDAIDAEIKGLTTIVAPEGTERIVISGNPRSGRASMQLLWKREKRFNSKRFKAAYQDLYESFREWSGHWEMRETGN